MKMLRKFIFMSFYFSILISCQGNDTLTLISSPPFDTAQFTPQAVSPLADVTLNIDFNSQYAGNIDQFSLSTSSDTEDSINENIVLTLDILDASSSFSSVIQAPNNDKLHTYSACVTTTNNTTPICQSLSLLVDDTIENSFLNVSSLTIPTLQTTSDISNFDFSFQIKNIGNLDVEEATVTLYELDENSSIIKNTNFLNNTQIDNINNNQFVLNIKTTVQPNKNYQVCTTWRNNIETINNCQNITEVEDTAGTRLFPTNFQIDNLNLTVNDNSVNITTDIINPNSSSFSNVSVEVRHHYDIIGDFISINDAAITVPANGTTYGTNIDLTANNFNAGKNYIVICLLYQEIESCGSRHPLFIEKTTAADYSISIDSLSGENTGGYLSESTSTLTINHTDIDSRFFVALSRNSQFTASDEVLSNELLTASPQTRDFVIPTELGHYEIFACLDYTYQQDTDKNNNCDSLEINVYSDTDDYGNNIESATEINISEQKTGNIEEANDEDFFFFILENVGNVNIASDGQITQLYDQFGEVIPNFSVDQDIALFPSKYYIRITSSTISDYTVSLKVQGTTQIPFDSTTDSVPIATGEENLYSFTVTQDGMLSIHSLGGDVMGTLFTINDQNQQIIIAQQDDYIREILGKTDEQKHFVFYRYIKIPDGQTQISVFLYVSLGKNNLSVTDYRLSASFISTCQEAIIQEDPYLGEQWYLEDTSNGAFRSNVTSAWTQQQGTDVNIAIIDDGVDMWHEDLCSNINTQLAYDVLDDDAITSEYAEHGTSVAGVAAAAMNGFGTVGVAYEAKIVPMNLLHSFTTSNLMTAFTNNIEDIAVLNNSWGLVAQINGGLTTITDSFDSIIEYILANGNNQRGTSVVFSSGNDGEALDSDEITNETANYNSYLTHYGVIVVCAINSNGKKTDYSETGANLWICAAGGDDGSTPNLPIVAPDISLVAGNNGFPSDNNYTYTQGTSFSAPFVSGVIALMSAENTQLTWRDIRLILAETAIKNDSSNNGWLTGATKITSGTYSFNNNYGFGLVDVEEALTVTKNWTNIPTMETFESNTTNTDNITITESGISFIEYINIIVNIDYNNFADLNITLTSPLNRESILTEEHTCTNSTEQPENCPITTWTFGSARHLGEGADGDWGLSITDENGNAVSTESWQLQFYGH